MSRPYPIATSRYRWVILLVATLTQAFACFFVQGIGAIAPFIRDDLKLTSLEIGILASAAQMVPLVGLLAAGELLDRFGERLVVGLGILIVAFMLMGAGLANDYLSILGFLLIVGAAYSAVQPGGAKAVSTWFPAKQRGFAMGIRQAGLPLGGALSAAALPIVALHWGWQATFLVGGATALLGALIFLAFYRDPPSKTLTTPPSEKIGLKAELLLRLSMLREPSMKNIMLSGVCLISVQYGILVFTALYLHDTLEMSVTLAGTLLFVAQGAGAAGRIVLAAWSDHCRAGRYFPVAVSMVAVIIGLAALIWLPSRSTLFLGILAAWLGFFAYGWYGPWVAYVAESAPAGKMGFALGLAMSVNQVAVIAAPPLLGLMKDATQSYLPGWVLLIALTFAALLATTWRRTGTAQ